MLEIDIRDTRDLVFEARVSIRKIGMMIRVREEVMQDSERSMICNNTEEK